MQLTTHWSRVALWTALAAGANGLLASSSVRKLWALEWALVIVAMVSLIGVTQTVRKH